MTEYYVYVYQRSCRYGGWGEYVCEGAIDIGGLSSQELSLFVEIMNEYGVCLIEEIKIPDSSDGRDYFVIRKKKPSYSPREKYDLNQALESANRDCFGSYQENLTFTLCHDVANRVRSLSEDERVVWNFPEPQEQSSQNDRYYIFALQYSCETGTWTHEIISCYTVNGHKLLFYFF